MLNLTLTWQMISANFSIVIFKQFSSGFLVIGSWEQRLNTKMTMSNDVNRALFRSPHQKKKTHSCASASPENARKMLNKVRELKTDCQVFHVCVFFSTAVRLFSGGLSLIHLNIPKQGDSRIGLRVESQGDSGTYDHAKVKGCIHSLKLT